VSSPFSSVEALEAKHEVADFDCGSDAQTTWLRRHARQSHAGGMSRVFVVRRLSDDKVVGYYALTTGSVLQADASRRLTAGAGGDDIPVVILTRLGIDVSEQGRGLGRALVVDAFRRIDRVADDVGIRALLIHAEDTDARAFYRRLAAFEPSPVDDLQLLLLMKDLRKAIPCRCSELVGRWPGVYGPCQPSPRRARTGGPR
jgi:GNAT superfamily N-acetyltransferase